MSDDLVKRLRGEYRLPITDGCGPPGGGSIQGGGDEPPPTHIEAADLIEALEAERDRLRPLAEAWVAHLEAQFQNDDNSAAYYDWRDALRQMEGAKVPTSAENVQLSSASD